MSNFHKLKIVFGSALIATFLIDYLSNIHLSVYLIIVGVFVGIVFLGTISMSLNLFAKSLTRSVFDNNYIALTFDDGPSANTIDVLNTLKKYNAKATFFCIGSRMESNSEIVKRIIADGHQVGNHSYSHSNTFPLFNKKRIVEEIQQTNRIINEQTGINNTLFRPPFGVLNPNIAKAASETNQHIIGWNIRSYDTTLSKKKVIDRVKSKLKNGSILLFHDNLADAAEILEAILQYTNEKGFETVNVKTIFSI